MARRSRISITSSASHIRLHNRRCLRCCSRAPLRSQLLPEPSVVLRSRVVRGSSCGREVSSLRSNTKCRRLSARCNTSRTMSQFPSSSTRMVSPSTSARLSHRATSTLSSLRTRLTAVLRVQREHPRSTCHLAVRGTKAQPIMACTATRASVPHIHRRTSR